MAAAYSALTVPQLKGMLGAALVITSGSWRRPRRSGQRRSPPCGKPRRSTSARLTSELQTQKSHNAALQRELDAVHAELEKANTVIVEQGRKLAAHSEVAELEKRLQIARRSAS